MSLVAAFLSGERGIRTLGTFRYTRFPIVPLRPLGHLSQNFALRNFGKIPRGVPPRPAGTAVGVPTPAARRLRRDAAVGGLGGEGIFPFQFSKFSSLAEREGFEPPVPLRVQLISNQAQSTG